MTVYGPGGTNTYHALSDHLGTVHALVTPGGTVAERYEYDAWGNVLGVFDGYGQPLPTSALNNRYLFQGREYSWVTHAAWGGAGLYYFRARYYDPSTGRWLSNDPIGISGGLNQYAFCANNPVNFTDPDGENPLGIAAAVLGVGVYVLNAPIPGVGRVQALTIAGTDITLVGWNYYRMDPLARNIIDQHEALHSNQSFWWAITHPIERETQAYRHQYDLAQDLLNHWWERTRLPTGGKAFRDVLDVLDSAKTHLEGDGPCK
jgi:RHS repeat-associated protein